MATLGGPMRVKGHTGTISFDGAFVTIERTGLLVDYNDLDNSKLRG